MRNNSRAQANTQLDLVSPLVELLGFIIKNLIKGLELLITYIYENYFQKNPPLKKIEREALNCKKQTKNPEALGMDCSKRRELLLSDINFKRHSFIVGASGFGKTNLISLLQEHSLQQGRPIIFFDPKADYDALMTFKNLCEKHGKTCHVFSEWYDKSIKLNPILEGTVNQVADRILRAFEWSEQFYKDCAYRLLTKVLRELQKDNKPFTLKTIHHELVTKHDSKEATGLIAKIEAIVNSDFGSLLEGTEANYTLSKIREEKACLYIGLSAQGYGETAMSIGKLFLEELLYNSYSTLKSETSVGKGLNNPIAVYFDEFGALVTPQFIELQNKCRGAGIELTMAVQTGSDIDRVNPNLTKQIIENAGNVFVMKQRLQEGAALFSESIGTGISKKLTHQTEDGVESGRASLREVNELLVHPDIIKNLKVGQCVLLRHDPTRINLLNLRERKKEEVTKKTQEEIKEKPKSGALNLGVQLEKHT